MSKIFSLLRYIFLSHDIEWMMNNHSNWFCDNEEPFGTHHHNQYAPTRSGQRMDFVFALLRAYGICQILNWPIFPLWNLFWAGLSALGMLICEMPQSVLIDHRRSSNLCHRWNLSVKIPWHLSPKKNEGKERIMLSEMWKLKNVICLDEKCFWFQSSKRSEIVEKLDYKDSSWRRLNNLRIAKRWT